MSPIRQNPGVIGEFEPVADMFTNQMVISGTFAYIADFTLGLAVMDVTDPAHPTLLGANSDESTYRLALQGQSAYALAGNTLILLRYPIQHIRYCWVDTRIPPIYRTCLL